MPIGGPIGGIDPALSAANGAKAPEAQGLGGMGSDAFLKLLVAQLRYQNPMAPTDGAAMLQQTAQFTQVETLKQLATSQKEMVSYHQASIASSLVGKEVTAVKEDGTEVTAVVDAVKFSSKGPVLRMGEFELPLDAAREIRIAGAGGATSA